MKNQKSVRVTKLDTDFTETTESYTSGWGSTETTTETATETNTFTEQDGGRGAYKTIVDSNYRKPRGGSKQDNMTLDDIKEKLIGYKALRTMEDKQVLKYMPVYRTFVRYINKETNQFRTGGLLMKVSYPDYIMLVNTKSNLTWSVQLKDNIIFVRDPGADVIEETQYKLEEREREEKEDVIKQKLYQMYKRGELRKK